MGPGNPLPNGEPVDYDDQLSKEHDYAYHFAKSWEDVRKADQKILAGFTADAVTNGNVHSAVGAVCIGAKYLAETLVGPTYPSRFRGGNPPMKNCREIKNYHEECDNLRVEKEVERAKTLNALRTYHKSQEEGSTPKLYPERYGVSLETLKNNNDRYMSATSNKLVSIDKWMVSNGNPTRTSHEFKKDRDLNYKSWNAPVGYKDKSAFRRGMEDGGSWMGKLVTALTSDDEKKERRCSTRCTIPEVAERCIGSPLRVPPTSREESLVEAGPKLCKGVPVMGVNSTKEGAKRQVVLAACGRPDCPSQGGSDFESEAESGIEGYEPQRQHQGICGPHSPQSMP
ncbi:hypothetical protein GE061_017676 [Apolygus lucorum]|uniref:Uncharacterized protein n=1 Tax=Apolygus lucorum TaxID=248454 RepID=A0A8S9XBU8_APOLU|nr:hypothetical protein GE061_017676 [Apolygus lucorum]